MASGAHHNKGFGKRAREEEGRPPNFNSRPLTCRVQRGESWSSSPHRKGFRGPKPPLHAPFATLPAWIGARTLAMDRGDFPHASPCDKMEETPRLRHHNPCDRVFFIENNFSSCAIRRAKVHDANPKRSVLSPFCCAHSEDASPLPAPGSRTPHAPIDIQSTGRVAWMTTIGASVW